MVDTLLRIRLFVAAYEERSFTAAAAREHSTQSGVTQHIQQLEDHFGIKLFLRGAGGISPTPAADAYYRSCLDVLRGHEQSRGRIEAFKGGGAGRIAVGLTPTNTHAALAPALDAFVAQHPNVVVQIVDAYSDVVIEKVRSGELDCCVVPGVHHLLGMRSEFFASSPEFLVCSAQTPLRVRHGKPVDLGKLGPLKIVMPTKAQKRRGALDDYLASVGAVVERRLEIDTFLGTLDFVARSDWVAIYPGVTMLREFDRKTLLIASLANPPLTVELFRIERTRDPPSAMALAFLDLLQKETVSIAQQAYHLGG